MELIFISSFLSNFNPNKNYELSLVMRKKGVEKLQNNNDDDHDFNKHLKILSCFNRSASLVTLIENNNWNLRMTFANRSMFLIHLKNFEESLIDVENFINAGKMDEDEKKLINTIKFLCKQLLKKYGKFNKQDDKIVKTISCSSELISFKFDENHEKKLLLFANENIEPNTIVVVALEKGFLFPQFPTTFLYCHHCLNLAWNALPCDTCSFNIYCSEKCKEEAWLQHHEIDCFVIKEIIMEFNNNYVYYGAQLMIDKSDITNLIIALKIFIKFLKKEGLESIIKQAHEIDVDKKNKELDFCFENGLFHSDKFQNVYGLKKTEKYVKVDVLDAFSIIITKIFFKFSYDFYLLYWMRQILTNLIKIVDTNFHQVKITFFLELIFYINNFDKYYYRFKITTLI